MLKKGQMVFCIWRIEVIAGWIIRGFDSTSRFIIVEVDNDPSSHLSVSGLLAIRRENVFEDWSKAERVLFKKRLKYRKR